MFETILEILGIKAPKFDPETLSRTASALVSLALTCIVFAIVWLAFASRSTRGLMLWLAPTAFAFLAAVFMLMAGMNSLRGDAAAIRKDAAAIKKSAAAIRKHIQPVDPGFHMGCRVGRRRLECGILKVAPQDPHLISAGLPVSQAEFTLWTDRELEAQLSGGALFSHATLGRFQQATLYNELIVSVNKLLMSAYRKSVHIKSIGIAVPGGVYPDLGHFDGLVEGTPFHADEDITGKVAERLVQEVDLDVLKEVLGTSDPEAMRAMINLDNDARCATRWHLVANPTWQNMACVFAGSGLGSGLVFGQEVFYGNRFRAGEIGHVNLNPGSLLLLDGNGDKALQPRHCSCAKEGYHFESLVGIGGLGHLAEVINKDHLGQICNAYMADPGQRKQIEAEKIDADDAKGMITLRALAYVGLQDRVFDSHRMPMNEKFLNLILHDGIINEYLAQVAMTYARLFGTGIAALLAALDIEHVVLCGTIPEFLHNNLRFTTEVQKSLDDNIPGEPRGAVSVHYRDMRHTGWRGAALLSNDPGYRRRRFPQSLSPREPKSSAV